MAMADVIVRIPHCVWRDGRPRFVPGPGLRKLGYAGRDLRHGPGGDWYTLAETKAESDRIMAEADERRGRKAGGAKRLPPVRRPPGFYTIADMFDEVDNSPRAGTLRRTAKPLAKKTLDFYRKNIATLRQVAPEIFAVQAAAVKKPHMFALSEKLLEQRGVAVMRAAMATLSRAFSYAEAKGRIASNPCVKLSIPVPPARVRAGTITEIASLIAAGDAIGRPDVADMIAGGVATGQRQGDRRGSIVLGRDELQRIQLRQSKRGALVAIKPPAFLEGRLARAAARRAAAIEAAADKAKETGKPARLPPANLFVNEASWSAWTEKAYGIAYRAVRAAAVAGVKNDAGGWIVEPCPSVADLRDQDLRDTHLTWLANANANIAQMRSTSGLGLQSITQTLHHYMAIDVEQSDGAIANLEAWLAKKPMSLVKG